MIPGRRGHGKHDIHLLGWTGDYNDPGQLRRCFFGGKSDQNGFDNPTLGKIWAAAGEADRPATSR